MVFRSRSTDPARNLSVEEWLLSNHRSIAASARGAVLFLYMNGPCMVIGRNQNPWAETGASPDSSLPVFRRSSGGGTVYHDEGNLNWALVVSRNAHDQDGELAWVAGAISSLGAQVLPGPRGGLFAGPGSRDPGAKVSGTARRFSADAVLHHGTLLVSSDLGRLESSLGGLVLEGSRALPSVRSRVANLSTLLPGLRPEEALGRLAEALAESPPLPVEDLVPPDALREDEARHRSWEWVYGETPAFTAPVELPEGQKATVEVVRGLVAAVHGAGDPAAWGWVPPPIGSRFDPAALGRAAPGGGGKDKPAGIEVSPMLDCERSAALGLVRAYVGSLGFDLSFQAIEEELAGFPAKYAPPDGAFLLARSGGIPVGCVGLKRIGDATCEMKRLYVADAWKGRGVGRLLALGLIDQAQGLGYARMRLDTIDTMLPAIALYESLGFKRIGAYVHNPMPGAVYMELDLGGPASPRRDGSV